MAEEISTIMRIPRHMTQWQWFSQARKMLYYSQIRPAETTISSVVVLTGREGGDGINSTDSW